MYFVVEKIMTFDILRYSKNHNIFNIFAIFATDSSLNCMTGKKDYKCGELMVL